MRDIKWFTGPRGATLLETVLVLSTAAILMGIAVPSAQRSLDRIVVRSAASDLASVLHSARTMALAGRVTIAVDADPVTGAMRVRRGERVLFTRNIASAHGVQVTQTRDSMAFGPIGLGRGAANLSYVIRRRAAAETVFVSRLGRIR